MWVNIIICKDLRTSIENHRLFLFLSLSLFHLAIISETYYFDQNLISFYFDQGDSGGPAICVDNVSGSSKSALCGIVSRGDIFECAAYGHPGIYAEVSYHIDWIKSHTEYIEVWESDKNEEDKRRINDLIYSIVLLRFRMLEIYVKFLWIYSIYQIIEENNAQKSEDKCFLLFHICNSDRKCLECT